MLRHRGGQGESQGRQGPQGKWQEGAKVRFRMPDLKEEIFLKLKNRVEDCIGNVKNTVRYYFLCRDCVKKVEYTGIGVLHDTENFRF